MNFLYDYLSNVHINSSFTLTYREFVLTNIHIRAVLVIRRRTHGRGERELVLDVIWSAARCLPVSSEAARANVFFIATLAGVGSFVCM